MNDSTISIAGEYISKFEDNEGDKRVIQTAPVVFTQSGNSIKGYSYISDSERKWILEGNVSSNGYVYGMYYAEDPIDKGIGNFFLEVKNNKVLEGIWSGYDSVNDKINHGKYVFRPVFNDFSLVELKNSYIPQILDISDSELGKDYLSYSELKKVISNSDDYICKVAMDNDDHKIMGFSLCIITDPENLKNVISWPGNKLPRVIKHSKKWEL